MGAKLEIGSPHWTISATGSSNLHSPGPEVSASVRQHYDETTSIRSRNGEPDSESQRSDALGIIQFGEVGSLGLAVARPWGFESPLPHFTRSRSFYA
jgi:hypothetical protein